MESSRKVAYAATGAALAVAFIVWRRARRGASAPPAELCAKLNGRLVRCPNAGEAGQADALLPEPTGAQCATVLAAQEVRVGELQFEVTVHRPSRLLLRDIEGVFKPDLQAAFEAQAGAYESLDHFLQERLLVMPLWQPAEQDLSVLSESVSAERRQLCKNFITFARALIAQLDGQWLDASDPRSGQALFGSPTTATYNELDGLTQCLKYKFEPFGCCGIVIHPRWGYNAYPVSVFTTAPLPVLVEAVRNVAQHFRPGE
jgi:hypothetical protein